MTGRVTPCPSHLHLPMICFIRADSGQAARLLQFDHGTSNGANVFSQDIGDLLAGQSGVVLQQQQNGIRHLESRDIYRGTYRGVFRGVFASMSVR